MSLMAIRETWRHLPDGGRRVVTSAEMEALG